MCEVFKKKYKEFFVCSFVLLNLLILSLVIFAGASAFNKIKEIGYIGMDIESRNTITVSDKGTIYAKPDLALTVFSVISESKTVGEAMSDNIKKMNAVIKGIKAQGIEEKDLKTTSFTITPLYEWDKTSSIYPEGKRTLAGYEVRQSLEVKIRDMEKIGIIVQTATDSGSNQVGDLQFTIENEDQLKIQAREQAINKAKDKAKELASQLGVKLVKISNFSENGVYPMYYYNEKASVVGMGGGDMQIETGENKIEITVSITYEIK